MARAVLLGAGVGNVRTLGAALLLLLAGCAVPDERLGAAPSDIQGGSPDSRDDAVVGVALLDQGGFVRRTCSGTLVAPNLVLTAQHCVADTPPFVDCRTSSFGPVIDASLVRITTSPFMWASDADWLPVTEVHPPPGARAVCGQDVALIVLAAPVDPERAAPMPPLLEASPARDEGYSAIGYGATEGGGDDAGLRRRRDALHVVCVGDACRSGQVAEPEWRGDHGVCNGDSGGPAVDRRGFVIGVTSRGPSGCEAPIYGGLLGHATWLRQIAKHAAHEASYEDPSWTVPVEEVRDASFDAPSSPGCAAAGGPAEGKGALFTALGLLGIVAALRRRLPP